MCQVFLTKSYGVMSSTTSSRDHGFIYNLSLLTLTLPYKKYTKNSKPKATPKSSSADSWHQASFVLRPKGESQITTICQADKDTNHIVVRKF